MWDLELVPNFGTSVMAPGVQAGNFMGPVGHLKMAISSGKSSFLLPACSGFANLSRFQVMYPPDDHHPINPPSFPHPIQNGKRVLSCDPHFQDIVATHKKHCLPAPHRRAETRKGGMSGHTGPPKSVNKTWSNTEKQGQLYNQSFQAETDQTHSKPFSLYYCIILSLHIRLKPSHHHLFWLVDIQISFKAQVQSAFWGRVDHPSAACSSPRRGDFVEWIIKRSGPLLCSIDPKGHKHMDHIKLQYTHMHMFFPCENTGYRGTWVYLAYKCIWKGLDLGKATF